MKCRASSTAVFQLSNGLHLQWSWPLGHGSFRDLCHVPCLQVLTIFHLTSFDVLDVVSLGKVTTRIYISVNIPRLARISNTNKEISYWQMEPPHSAWTPLSLFSTTPQEPSQHAPEWNFFRSRIPSEVFVSILQQPCLFSWESAPCCDEHSTLCGYFTIRESFSDDE